MPGMDSNHELDKILKYAGLAGHQQEKPLLLLLFGCGLFRFAGIILQHG